MKLFLLALLLFTIQGCGCKTTYVMLDGNVCKYKSDLSYSGGAGVGFDGCKENKKYINPASYQELNSCEK